MHEDLAHLVELDRLDRAFEKSTRATQTMRDELKSSEEAIEQAKRFADALQDQLAASRDRQHDAERKAKRYRDRQASAKAVFDTGIGDFAAAERQLEECGRILDDLETVILEEMEKQDDLVVRQRTAEAEITKAETILAEHQARAPDVFQGERDTRASLQAEREATKAALDPDLFDRYERVCARRKRAVAPVIDGDICAACMHALKPQQRIELTRERIVTCDSCHRWLYVPET